MQAFHRARGAPTLSQRLEAEGVLVDGKITDRRLLARMAVRACLEVSAAGRVQYEDPEGPERGMAENARSSYTPMHDNTLIYKWITLVGRVETSHIAL